MKKRPLALLLLCGFLAAVPVLLAHPDDDGSADHARASASPGLQGGKATAGDDRDEDDKDGKKKEKWDVNNPPGPSTTATIDVREGTWMSVDVSPDGKEIVFDLLGDLYTIPFAGGEARALTADVAWQEQPRYSPDGKSIAFSSDQGGGDNIWIIDRDGKNPRQVTKETFRLVNSPAWTPDGESIVVRKHFTARRSAGAGEMWLYHRSGGEGLQVTKRPNDQKDAGEPAFSPDGRYLYYSQDTTPGSTFEYSKDVNGQIYVIQRLDRETGETEAIVTGPGGAIRPTPSPDGKTLAFIRRVRGKSVLHLQDLRSGEAWPLFDGLDRDLQETWAVHGVYPGMAWTSDSRSLVFWAGGKIRRLDVASRQVAEIPFHVKATRRISQALRYPVQVAPERFEVKMLRHVDVAPAGDKVVYQALGHLWIRDLPTGTPRRLTTQNDHFEVFPSFSRDGRSIVYATWDDEKLGSLRVVSADGSGERTLTREPGHYVEPVFSPDGRWVVYRKAAGGGLRTPVWSREPGLYKVPAAGGEAERVSRRGALPHFGARSDRLYFQDGVGDSGGVGLFVVHLDGERDEHQVLSSKRATEYRVSPDGRFVAFRESYNSYIAPFLPTGQSAEIGPKVKSIPVAKVSRDEGDNLRWSGDGKRLYWTLGPELFSRDLPDAFAFLAGAPKKLPEPPVRGLGIGFSAAADVPQGKVAVVGGRVVTMNGTQVIEDGVVLIQGNRIQAVGKRGEVAVPADAHVIDAAGKTVLPGLIDVHWHGSFGDDGLIPEESWINAASLAFGLTTLHDPSNDTEMVFAASELAKAGMITAPRIFSTGTILYGADAPYTVEIEGMEDARASLRRLKAVGAWSVKSYNQPRREQRQQVIAAARELNLMVVPEGGSLFPYNMTMIVDGHTGIEHALPIARVYEDVKQLWSASKTGYTPTLGVAYGGIFGENYWYDRTKVWENERLSAFVPREVLDPRSRRRVTAPDEEYNHIQAAKAAKELLDRGVSIQLGAHGQREGLAVHWEMWMMAQGGMTPFEILRAATLDGARYLGLDGDIGSLTPGKLADVIILDKNPLDDIRNSESVHQVIANGRVYDAATLNEVYPRERKRQPFYWEREKPAFPGD